MQYHYKNGCITGYILVQTVANACTTYTHVKSNFLQILAYKTKTNDKYKNKKQNFSTVMVSELTTAK